MRKNLFGISTIEILVIVGVLGLMLFVGAKSYRSYLGSIEFNNTNIDFDNVVKFIGRELQDIQESLERKPENTENSVSQELDSIQEWFDLIKTNIDLKTDNVIIESIDGTIADKNLIVKIGLRPGDSIEARRKSICWNWSSSKCL